MLITKKQVEEMHRLSARKGVTGVGKPNWHARKPYTMVAVKRGDRTGVGFAKCSPKDPWNEEVGFNIALSRAIDDIRSGK